MGAAKFPDRVEIVVEIPRGSRNKYEFDEQAGVYRLDRVLSSAVFYNFDYGFIEGTRADDGDHTDALLVIDEPTFTGCHVWARPVGVLEMRDDKGADFKVLCVAEGDPNQAHIERLEQMRPHRLVEIEHFFNTYKLLEDKTVEDRALEILPHDREAWERERAAPTGCGEAGTGARRRSTSPGRCDSSSRCRFPRTRADGSASSWSTSSRASVMAGRGSGGSASTAST